MKRITVILLGGTFFSLSGAFLSPALENSRQAPSSAGKPTVYVSDFELDIAPPNAGNQASGTPTASTGSSPTAGGAQAQQPGGKPLTPEQLKRKHASELVNWMSASLMTELQKAGYGANRLHGGDSRPSSGVGIRGLFAEIDKENHLRRVLIRGGDDSGKMQILVSVSNLAKPEQSLYEIAQLPGNEPKPGAAITLSPFVPLSKYEMDKQADQAAFQVVASRVVSDLTALLAANPAALTQ
jgi:hypothetical protein